MRADRSCRTPHDPAAVTNSRFTPTSIVPDGYAALAFSCDLPGDWVRMPFPAEEVDFSNPLTFAPLLMLTAPYGTVVFTVAARPKYDDGSVEDWANYLCDANNLTVERMQEAGIAQSPCVLCDATMESEVGRMRSRSVFLEDGGRLFNIGALAPQEIWSSVESTFARLIGSFRLNEVNGLSAAPMREMRADAKVDLTSHGDDTTTEETATPAVEKVEATPASVAATSEESNIALADDASSLDPENDMNVRLRDSGAGLTVRTLDVDLKTKRATVGAGAIEAVFRVPLGWHVIDDGKRTLIFDKPGKMQISLNLRPGTKDEHFSILQGIGDELAAANPTAEFLKMMLGELPCLAIRKLPVDGELLQQAYIVHDSRRPDLALVARVTSDDEHMTLAMDTVEVVLTSYAEKLQMAS